MRAMFITFSTNNRRYNHLEFLALHYIASHKYCMHACISCIYKHSTYTHKQRKEKKIINAKNAMCVLNSHLTWIKNINING